MKVFKFGGASVSSVDKIKNVKNIIDLYADEKLVIIISAMGKTTNALEKVAESFYAGNKDEALSLFDAIKNQHITTTKYLLVTHFNECMVHLNDFFTEVEWLLNDAPKKSYDYYYDQIVCTGELLSTCIVSCYLNEAGTANKWFDARDVIKTDNTFRDANVNWKLTEEKVSSLFKQFEEQNGSVNRFITQGFIGSTDENESTTLGREGSDFTAAIFSNLLDAENLTIWKDVEGVMSADPKQFPEATFLKNLSYDEVIEMAYYGAQVIHPKTIKPLQNKGIPLHVKCFIDASLPGTLIYKKNIKDLPPILIVKQNQALMHFHSKDFSFIGEKLISELYHTLSSLAIKPNLIQTGAISLQLCFDERTDKIEQLAAEASRHFDVEVEKDLQLLTIRHFKDELLMKMTQEKEIVLRQQTRDTVQVLYR